MINEENLNKFIAEYEKNLREGHMRNPNMYKLSLHEATIKMKARIMKSGCGGGGIACRAARKACITLGIAQTLSAIKKYVGVTK